MAYTPAPITVSMTRDAEGYREYKVTYLIKAANILDGPATILTRSDLPQIGDTWAFGTEVDDWAFLWPEVEISRHQEKEGEANEWWTVQYKYSTRPLKRCQDNSIESPLDEPPKLSGSFTSYMKEAQQDRNGNAILSSSLERITGLEKDVKMPTVVVEFNSMSLDLPTITQVIVESPLNDAPLWGVAARCVRLTNFSWSRQLYGTCTYYYTKRFEFEIKFDTHDLSDVADMGFKVYAGNNHGGAGANPKNYEVYKDDKGENITHPIMLDGDGNINEDPVGNPQFIPTVELYGESNLLSLGIPSSL